MINEQKKKKKLKDIKKDVDKREDDDKIKKSEIERERKCHKASRKSMLRLIFHTIHNEEK